MTAQLTLCGPRGAALTLAAGADDAAELRTLLDMTGLLPVPRARKRSRPVTAISKQCSTCGQVKHADGFYRLPTSADGLAYRCKVCVNTARRGRPGNPPKVFGSKRCARCRQVKNADDFRRARQNADGRASWCKACASKAQQNRRANPAWVTGTKRCSRCGQVKPVSEFHRNRLTRDGRASRCKPCTTEYGREWRKGNRSRRHKLADTIVIDYSRVKPCTRCRKVKPASEFHRDQEAADGLAWWCRTCINEYKRNWRAGRAPGRAAVRAVSRAGTKASPVA